MLRRVSVFENIAVTQLGAAYTGQMNAEVRAVVER